MEASTTKPERQKVKEINSPGLTIADAEQKRIMEEVSQALNHDLRAPVNSWGSNIALALASLSEMLVGKDPAALKVADFLRRMEEAQIQVDKAMNQIRTKFKEGRFESYTEFVEEAKSIMDVIDSYYHETVSLKSLSTSSDRLRTAVDRIKRVTLRLRRYFGATFDMLAGNTFPKLSSPMGLHNRIREILSDIDDDIRTEYGVEVKQVVNLNLKGENSKLLLYIDPGRMHTVFQNLIENSIKYSHKDIQPRIDIRIERVDSRLLKRKHGVSTLGYEGDWIMVTYVDNALGFSDAAASVAFKRFARYDVAETRGRNKGLGLGLYRAKRAVEEHGGFLGISHTGSSGTTFLICLPVNPNQISHEGRA